MIREIKFRAWHKATELMDEVVTIDLYDEEIGVLYANPITQGEDIQRFDFDEIELMESTGLKDKNGVEIYEGDVVQYTFDDPTAPFVGEVGKKLRIHPIFWSEWRASFAIGNKNANDDLFRYVRNGNTVEVIGNIYEKPELLKER